MAEDTYDILIRCTDGKKGTDSGAADDAQERKHKDGNPGTYDKTEKPHCTSATDGKPGLNAPKPGDPGHPGVPFVDCGLPASEDKCEAQRR